MSKRNFKRLVKKQSIIYKNRAQISVSKDSNILNENAFKQKINEIEDADYFEECAPEKTLCEKLKESESKLKYFPPQSASKCCDCQEISQKLDLYKDTVEKQNITIMEILSEHKILLDRLVSVNTTIENIFPIDTDNKLKELDTILATHGDPYKQRMKTLIAGNTERNLHQVLGRQIILNYNVDGLFGKKGLRDFKNVFSALIDIISNFNEFPDKNLRTAFQRQKKKYFKQKSRSKASNTNKGKNEESTVVVSEEEIASDHNWVAPHAIFYCMQ